MRRVTGLVVAALCLAACEGDTAADQIVTVTSDPPGASCNVSRENMDLGTVPATPGSLRVTKGAAPLIVACTAAGSETITGSFEARFRGSTLLSGGGGGPPAVDARLYSYPDTVNITLRR
jgi:hypothetical protein